ncbi:MAG: cyclic nucleotide-binding domain-containing protein [Pseudomonadota bacterium]
MGENAHYLGLLAGVVLVAAMVPTQVRTIRLLALAAGLLALAYLGMSGGSILALAIAAAFVIVNAMRLAELHRRARRGNMTAEERELFDHVMQMEDPNKQNRLRDLMQWRDVDVGEALIAQDQLDPPLIYIATGRAKIVRDAEIVGECAGGEFVGEMSHISGQRASASVEVTEPMRMAQIDRDALAQLARSVPEIGRAVDSAFNRSLAAKVMRMNQTTSGDAG